jgi:hypothetical protein
MHKHLIRRGLMAVAIVACLGWGGYQLGNQDLSAAIPPRPGVIVSDGEIARQYPGLPVAVARAERSVVATRQMLKSDAVKAIIASGVIINGNQVATAGHNVEDSSSIGCKNFQVITPGVFEDSGANKDPVIGVSFNHAKSTDVAVLTVQTGVNFQSLPPVRIASRPPSAGQTVYFINYQPTAEGKLRSPSVKPSLDSRQDYSRPAIFAGTVVGTSPNGVAIVTGYGKSLGRGAPDVMVRKGASGGAVVNSDGELVGLSVSSESLQADLSSGTVYQMFGYEPPDGKYQLAYMQPVNPAILGRLQSSTISCY